MYLGERYQIDTTEHSNLLRVPEGQQQPAKPLLPGAIVIDNTDVVYRGIDRQTGQAVAIKVLRSDYAMDVKFVTRFQRQASIAMKLQHPKIVQVYDYGQVDGNYFMVMELIEGTDLRGYLRSRGVLDTERAILIAHDVALALGAAHDSHIIHANVNTTNILTGRSGTIKLTNFYGMSLGSRRYCPPEQLQGYALVPATDVYALGIIMYEMLTGRTPFDGDTPVEIAMKHIHEIPVPPGQFNPNIPQALEEIIMRCLEKDPEKRYRNGSELARALQELA